MCSSAETTNQSGTVNANCLAGIKLKMYGYKLTQKQTQDFTQDKTKTSNATANSASQGNEELRCANAKTRLIRCPQSKVRTHQPHSRQKQQLRPTEASTAGGSAWQPSVPEHI